MVTTTYPTTEEARQVAEKLFNHFLAKWRNLNHEKLLNFESDPSESCDLVTVTKRFNS